MSEVIILIVSVFFFFQAQVMLNYLVTLSTKLPLYLFEIMGKLFGGILLISKSTTRLIGQFFKMFIHRKKAPTTEQPWLKIKL